MSGSGDRADGDFEGLRESWQAARERSRLNHEVLDAVRSNAEGRTRAELRELVASERARRGLQPLPELVLDRWVDEVLHGQSLGAQAKTTVDLLASLVRSGLRVVDTLRERSAGQAERPHDDAVREGMRGWDIDWQATRGVRLDTDAFDFVDKFVERALFRFEGVAAGSVRLVPIVGTAGATVEVRLEDRSIGELAAEDTATVLGRLARDEGEPMPARVFAIFARSTPEEPPKVHIGTPGRARRSREESDETLWGRVSTRPHHYHYHCLVCGEPCDWFQERSALVARSRRRSFQGWNSGAVHRRCWAAGVARAEREGAGWRDAEVREDERP